MPKLTEKYIEALQPQDREHVVWDSEVIGLGVRVQCTGSKSIILMYGRGGEKCKHTMGAMRVAYGVKEARERAKDLLQRLRDGVDPQEAKAEERQALSVAELAYLYLGEEAVELGHRPRALQEPRQAAYRPDAGGR